MKELCLMLLESDVEIEENWFVVSKMTRIWWTLTWALEIIKFSTLISSFSAKCITFGLIKYTIVFFHDTEEWCKIFGLENDIRNMVNFYQSTWKCWNWDFDGILLSKKENEWA